TMDKNKAISGYENIFDDGYKAGRASVVLPHPCDGELYKSWTSSDYFAKIAEEHLEVIDAYKTIEKSNKQPTKEERDHFFKECTDLIVATTGLMHYLGCDEKMRQQYMKEINESNAKRDGGRQFANEELPASTLAFPVFKDSEKSDPMKNTECLLPEYLDEFFRDKKIDGETVTLLRGEKYGKFALRVGDELYYVSYEPLKKVDNL
ncbi:MAG: hypothetical protein PUI60_07050, partial [Dialister sp.]|nr:hypothetical protein [Dialister sp.]MDY6116105.1 hypothetical protein [Dialister sp.]